MRMTLATKSFLAIKRKKRSKARGPWSDLYPDLLREIFKHLDIVDVVRSRAVCVSWRSILMNTMKKDQRCLCCFQTTQQDKVTEYINNLPEVLGRRCVASSRGFIITIDHRGRISAVNLFIRASFILVPADTNMFFDEPHLRKWVTYHDACRSIIVAKGNVELDLGFSQADIPTSIDAIAISATGYATPLVDSTEIGCISLSLCYISFAKAGEDSLTDEMSSLPWRLMKIMCADDLSADIIFHEGCLYVLR